MGALDDAIREHLELKRRHGASDEEIQQAEAEALGPARRSVTSEPFIDEAGMPAPPEAFEDAPPAPGDAVADAPPAPGEAVADAPPPPPDLEPEPEPSAPYDADEEVRPVPLRPDSFTSVVESAPVQPPPVEPAPVEPAPVESDPVEAPEPGTPKPHGDPAADEFEPPPPDDGPDRARTAILDDPLRDPPPIHREPDPDEPP